MPERQPTERGDAFEGIRQSLNFVRLALAFLAKPYRNVMYVGAGCRAIGLIDLLAVLVLFPMFVGWMGQPETREGAVLFFWAWRAQGALLAIQFVASQWSGSPRHSNEIGRPWARELGGFLLTVAGCALAFPHCRGISAWLFLGWAANTLQVTLIHARHGRMAQLALDQRIEGEAFRDARERMM